VLINHSGSENYFVKHTMSAERLLHCLLSASDCKELLVQIGGDITGVQEITPIDGGPKVQVQCDSEGWTVFQSRGQFGNDKLYFYKEWASYEEGFGVAGKCVIFYKCW
jgi:hypothetical protein